MKVNIKKSASEYISDLKILLDEIDLEELNKAEKLLFNAYSKGRKIFIIGNGGSASTASHMACDFSKTVRGLKGNSSWQGFKAFSLTDNHALVTAWTNDTSYHKVYVEQIKNFGEKKDILIAMSSSGNSKNIVDTAKEAKKMRMKVITISGFGGGKLAKTGDVNLVTHSKDYGPIEDIQLIIDHILINHFYNKFKSTPELG